MYIYLICVCIYTCIVILKNSINESGQFVWMIVENKSGKANVIWRVVLWTDVQLCWKHVYLKWLSYLTTIKKPKLWQINKIRLLVHTETTERPGGRWLKMKELDRLRINGLINMSLSNTICNSFPLETKIA